MGTVRYWFGELSEFNAIVRNHVGAHVEKTIGPEMHIPLVLTLPLALMDFCHNLDYHVSSNRGQGVLLADISWAFFMSSTLAILVRVAVCFPWLPDRLVFDHCCNILAGTIVATIVGLRL